MCSFVGTIKVMIVGINQICMHIFSVILIQKLWFYPAIYVIPARLQELNDASIIFDMHKHFVSILYPVGIYWNTFRAHNAETQLYQLL